MNVMPDQFANQLNTATTVDAWTLLPPMPTAFIA
jgi:hypothetical protein